MLKCLLWGSGKVLLDNIKLAKYYEALGQYKICAITARNLTYSQFDNIPCILSNQINPIDYDIIIIMSHNYVSSIIEDAQNMGFKEEVIIPIKVLKLLGFDTNKYLKIKSNPPSIICSNCWGGVAYNALGLQFASPFINMFEDPLDYIKIINNLEHYMRQDITLDHMQYEPTLKTNYPVAWCDDVLLHFNHYTDFDDAKSCWERRKKRINWDNLLFVMYESDPNIAAEFSKAKPNNKFCFTSFPSDDSNHCYINLVEDDKLSKLPFWELFLGTASGKYPYFDIFEFLTTNSINLVTSVK